MEAQLAEQEALTSYHLRVADLERVVGLPWSELSATSEEEVQP